MASDLIPVEPIQGEIFECGAYCPRCGSECAEIDAFCRKCGNALPVPSTAANALPVPAHAAGNQLAPQFAAMLNRRWVVVGVLLVAGPIGLPALWFSPKFSPPTKIITTMLYFGLTVVAPLAAAWYWLDFAMQPLVEAFHQSGIR